MVPAIAHGSKTWHEAQACHRTGLSRAFGGRRRHVLGPGSPATYLKSCDATVVRATLITVTLTVDILETNTSTNKGHHVFWCRLVVRGFLFFPALHLFPSLDFAGPLVFQLPTPGGIRPLVSKSSFFLVLFSYSRISSLCPEGKRANWSNT